MRGENFIIFLIKTCHIGSPPLARGKPVTRLMNPLQSRITPACAGKTKILSQLQPCDGDHPRLRGENVLFLYTLISLTGSPPLARGKLASGSPMRTFWRITPACAGKTRRCITRTSVEWDHPRLRGENTKKSLDLRDPCFLSYHISFNLNSHFLCSFLKSFHIFETISCNHPMLYVSVFLIHNMPLT